MSNGYRLGTLTAISPELIIELDGGGELVGPRTLIHPDNLTVADRLVIGMMTAGPGSSDPCVLGKLGGFVGGSTPPAPLPAFLSLGNSGSQTTGTYNFVYLASCCCQGVFTVPPSGAVTVISGALTRVTTAGQYAGVGWELRAGATPGSGAVVLANSVYNMARNYNTQYCTSARTRVVYGLTPGQVLNIRQLAYLPAASGAITESALQVLPVPT